MLSFEILVVLCFGGLVALILSLVFLFRQKFAEWDLKMADFLKKKFVRPEMDSDDSNSMDIAASLVGGENFFCAYHTKQLAPGGELVVQEHTFQCTAKSLGEGFKTVSLMRELALGWHDPPEKQKPREMFRGVG